MSGATVVCIYACRVSEITTEEYLAMWTQLEHKDYSVWNQEMLGCDLTVAKHKSWKTFAVWVQTADTDPELIGERGAFLSATKLAEMWAIHR